MKAFFYWPDCTLHFHIDKDGRALPRSGDNPRPVFWVGATRQEVEDHLTERMVNFNIIFRKMLLNPVLLNPVEVEEGYTLNGPFYFLVPQVKRLLDPAIPMPKTFPYPYNVGSPWLAIGKRGTALPHEPEGIGLQKLDELEQLGQRIRRHGYIEFE